jgi:small subunit ribosomal protein S6
MPQQPDERGITKGGTVRERIRNYELVIIISPLHADEESANKIIDSLQESIESFGGSVTAISHSSPWGRRKLAFPIRAYAGGEASRRVFHEGFYVLMNLTLASTRVRDLEVAIKYTDPILRHLIVLLEDAPRPTTADSADAAAADIEHDSDLDAEDAYDEGEEGELEDVDDTGDDEDIDADDIDDTEVVHDRAE